MRSKGRTGWRESFSWDLLGSGKLADVDKMAMDGRRCGHGGTDQVSAAAGALASFEIAVAGGGAAFARIQPVGVHGQAHRAARLAPLEACRLEDLVQAFTLGLVFPQARAGNHHREL